MDLNNDEIRRYSRRLILPKVGLAGQRKIRIVGQASRLSLTFRKNGVRRDA